MNTVGSPRKGRNYKYRRTFRPVFISELNIRGIIDDTKRTVMDNEHILTDKRKYNEDRKGKQDEKGERNKNENMEIKNKTLYWCGNNKGDDVDYDDDDIDPSRAAYAQGADVRFSPVEQG